MTVALALLALQDPPPRRPEPEAEKQKESLKILRDLFKDEYARRAPADQQALARKLLQQGLGTKDDDTARFVLLKEAADVAAGAGDLETAVRATDELGRAYEVDGPALTLAALNRIAAAARDPSQQREAGRAYLACAEAAVAADGYDTAAAALARAEAAARAGQDSPTAARAQELKRELPGLRDEHKKAVAGDPQAAGRYLCFVKGDWARGLPLLAQEKGGLGPLAEKDRSDPADPAAQIEIGEGWWEAAKKEKSSWRKPRIVARARYRLEQAAGSLTGLAKVKADKRLEEIEAAQPGVVSLLRLVDPKKDSVNGVWTLQDGALVSERTKWARIEIPYRPPVEYDLRLVLSRVAVGPASAVIVSRQGKSFACVFGGGGVNVGLGECRGAWIDNPTNPTTRPLPEVLAVGRAYAVLVEVRRDRVRVSIDDKVVLDWKTDYSDLSPNASWKLRDDTLLGLASYECPTAFQKITLVEVAGTGKRVR